MTEREMCLHEECGFENRLEYCDVEARDEETVEIVLALADELLFESNEVTSSQYHHKNTTEHGVSERSFSYIAAEQGIVPELQVYLSHERQHSVGADFYDIQVSRRQSDIAGGAGEWLTTRYLVEHFDHGDVLGAIDRVSPLITEQGYVQEEYSVEMMRAYDYIQLFEDLAEVCNLHDIEHIDNQNSFRAAPE